MTSMANLRFREIAFKSAGITTLAGSLFDIQYIYLYTVLYYLPVLLN